MDDPQLAELRGQSLAAIEAATSLVQLQALEREALGKGGRRRRAPGRRPEPAAGRATRARQSGQRAEARGRGAALAERARATRGRRRSERERSGAGFDPTLPGAARRARLAAPDHAGARASSRTSSPRWATTVLDGPEVETELLQLRGAQHPAPTTRRATCRTRSGCDRTGAARAAHAHLAGAGARDASALQAAVPRDRRPAACFRNETADATPRAHLPPDGGPGGRRGRLRRAPDRRDEDAPARRLRARASRCACGRATSRSSSPASSSTCAARSAQAGCRVCKRIDAGSSSCRCGMVHPNVLRAGGIDPERVDAASPSASGSRASSMLRYGIDDVRLLLCAATCASWSSSESHEVSLPLARAPRRPRGHRARARSPSDLTLLDGRGRGRRALRAARSRTSSSATCSSASTHPDADKLSRLHASTSAAREPLQIVCGAPNVARRAEGRRARAVGTTLPGGVKIKKAKIRGVESRGHDLLRARARARRRARRHLGAARRRRRSARRSREALGLDDWVIEIDNKSLTHRPDLWGHRGFARELAAIYGRPLQAARRCACRAAGDGAPLPGAHRGAGLLALRRRSRSTACATRRVARLAALPAARGRPAADRPARRPLELRDARPRAAEPRVRPRAARRRTGIVVRSARAGRAHARRSTASSARSTPEDLLICARRRARGARRA